MFGCLADKAYANDDSCLIHDSNACNFGIAVGVIGMIMCLGFFTKDVTYIILKQNKVSNTSTCLLCIFIFATRLEVFCCWLMPQHTLSGDSFGLCHSVSWWTSGEEWTLTDEIS